MLQQRPEFGKKVAPVISEGQIHSVGLDPVGSTWRLPETPSSSKVPQFYEVERTLCLKKQNKIKQKQWKQNARKVKSCSRNKKRGPRKNIYTYMNNEFVFWALALLFTTELHRGQEAGQNFT